MHCNISFNFQALAETVEEESSQKNVTEKVVATVIFTIFDSQCRTCGQDGRYGCITKVCKTVA
jgi:hypothetical protein